MSDHTPEPWEVDPSNSKDECWAVAEARGKTGDSLICVVAAGDKPDEANARRIVACVNACRGISTRGLEIIVEAGGTALDPPYMTAAEASMLEMQIERDRARAALHDIANLCDRGLASAAEPRQAVV